MVEATRLIESPTSNFDNYYEYWAYVKGISGNDQIEVPLPGAGSDHTAFLFYLGIPSIDVAFASDDPNIQGWSWFSLMHNLIVFESIGNDYPTYHTGFETFYLMDNLIDSQYQMHKICTQLNLVLSRTMADEVILDLKPEEYGLLMLNGYDVLVQQGVISTLNGLNMTTYTAALRTSINGFDSKAKDWRDRFDLNSANETKVNPLMNTIYSDQIMKVDRAFLLPNGLPDQPNMRHAIISPAKRNSYGNSVFPGIWNIYDGLVGPNGSVSYDRLDQMKRHFSDLIVVIKRAGDILKDLSHII